jgi:hypothetical protein
MQKTGARPLQSWPVPPDEPVSGAVGALDRIAVLFSTVVRHQSGQRRSDFLRQRSRIVQVFSRRAPSLPASIHVPLIGNRGYWLVTGH